MTNLFAELNKEAQKQKNQLNDSRKINPTPKNAHRREIKKSKDILKTIPKPTILLSTSQRHDVTTSLRDWKNIIENTEVQNSSLRLTPKEKQNIEDLITTLKRKYKIKTSMNEISRLGLLYLLDNFNNKEEDSLIIKVKNS